MDSTDDARRGGNNSMRHQYRTLSETEKEAITLIKSDGMNFELRLSLIMDQAQHKAGESGGPGPAYGREFAIARTKIEEAVMWAVKGITK